MSATPEDRTPIPSTPLGRQGVVTMAGAAVLLGLLVVGMAQEQAWVLFAKPVEFRTTDANGLSPGLPVRLAGYPIGRVDRVELGPDALVRVSLRIQPAYRAMLGPRSRFHLDQEGIVGTSYLAATADPSGPGRQDAPLVVTYEPPVDVKEVLIELAESRIPLNRLLERTAQLAETSLPRTLHGMDRTIAAAGNLSQSLQQQSTLTATQARQTLRTYDALGQEGQASLKATQQDLGTILPLLRETLVEVRTTAQTSQKLLDRLSGSWLMPLLDGSTPSPAPAAGAARR